MFIEFDGLAEPFQLDRGVCVIFILLVGDNIGIKRQREKVEPSSGHIHFQVDEDK